MQRVSGPDAAFLYGETRSWHMHVSSILMADPSTAPHGFSIERLRENTAKRIEQVPQFRWRVVAIESDMQEVSAAPQGQGGPGGPGGAMPPPPPGGGG